MASLPVMSAFQEIAYFDAGECLRLVNQPHREGFSQSVAERAARTMKDVLGSEEYAKRKPHVEAALRGQRVTFERRMSGNGRGHHLQIDYVPELAERRTARVRGAA